MTRRRALKRSALAPGVLGGVLAAVLTLLLVAGFSSSAGAASSKISGRGIVQSGAGADAIPVFFTVTVPNDEKVNGESAEIKTAGAKVYENVGQTTVGGPLKPVKRKRIRSQNVTLGSEILFVGTYSLGDAKSVKATTVYVTDRSFAVCGKLQGITRRTAAGANQNTITVENSKRTVQEKRYGRFFEVGKDVVFSFGDDTQFHNANGSWRDPKNRVSIQAADITADQQVTVVRGKITGGNSLDAEKVDLGVKCS